MAQSHCFVGLKPRGAKSYLYNADKRTKFRQVIWGDFLTIDGEEAGGWLRIIWAPKDPQKKATVYIQKEDTVEKRPLEIVFVDVGQGDGCVLISPETGKKERITVIDAGIGSNMIRFLNGRFRAYRGFKFDAAILTHPDEDHYGGFLEIFQDPDIGFNTVYHSGLVERPVSGQFDKIGGIDADGYATELPQTKEDVQELFPESVNNLSYRYPKVMRAAIDNAAIGDIRMLSTAHGDEDDGVTYMPGYAPSDKRGYAIRVLGPVVEPDGDGNPRLRKLGSYGETKNGHSVLLRLAYG
ncbi:MBL fold metallo-hydrolase, partial [bacterium]